MKTTTHLFFSLLLSFLCLYPSGVLAAVADIFTDAATGLEYKVLTDDGTTGGTAMVTGPATLSGSLTITATVTNTITTDDDGNPLSIPLILTYTVTKIDDNAFAGQSGLSGTLTLPDATTFTSIGANAFAGQSGLSGTLTLPDGLAAVGAIGDGAFSGTGISQVIFPNGITSIGNEVFKGCSQLGTVSLTGITSIGANAFAQSGLSGTLTLPVGLASIGAEAFKGCSLTKVELPNISAVPTITIASDAFDGVTATFTCLGGREFYYVSGWHNYFPDLTDDVFTFSTDDDNNDGTTVTTATAATVSGFKNGNITNGLNIPDQVMFHGKDITVTSIGANAFKSGTNALSGALTFGNVANITSIGEDAFNGQSGLNGALDLSNLTGSNGNGTGGIGKGAFAGTGISAVTLPTTGQTVLNAEVFKGCDQLTTVNGTLPATIGKEAFAESGLTTVNLAGVTTIDEKAFYDCNGLTSVTFSSGITSIGEYAFAESGLTGVSLDLSSLNGSNGNGTGGIGIGAFSGTGITSVQLPTSGLTSIAEAVFKGSQLGTFPSVSSLTTIGKEAFANTQLTTVDLSANTSLATIGINAFNGSTNLDEVTLPNATGVIAIQDGAFAATALGTFYLKSTTAATLPTLGSGVFTGVTGTLTFDIPSGTRKYYYASSSWQAYFPDPTNYNFDFTPNTEILDSDGVTTATTATVTGFKNVGATITDLNILDKVVYHGADIKVTEIAAAAFKSDNGTLTGTLTLPTGTDLTKIGANAFNGQGGLTGTLTLPNGLAADGAIGDGAFAGTGIGAVTFPNGIGKIGAEVFKGCKQLGTVNLTGITTIGNYAFAESGLSSVTLTTNATIGNYAFNDCKSLHSVSFPAGVTIGEYAFAGSGLNGALALASLASTAADGGIGIGAFSGTGLTSVTLPTGNGMNKINNAVFKGTGLTSVNLTGIREIGDNAFESAALSGTLTLPDGLQSIGEYAFKNCASLTKIELPVISSTNAAASLGTDAFAGVPLNANTFTCPTGTRQYYTVAQGWSTYFADPTYDFEFAEVAGIGADNGTATINGFKTVGATITGLTIPVTVMRNGNDYNVIAIADGAFTSDKGTLSGTLTLTDAIHLVKIGANAFKGSGLTIVMLPSSGLEEIGEYAFDGSGLTTLNGSLPTNIGKGAFKGTELGSVMLPAGLSEIKDEVFSGCSLLTTVNGTLPAKIGKDAFNGTGFTTVGFGTGLKDIGASAFAKSKLASVTFAADATIGASAFAESDLTAVTLAAGAKIGEKAFYKSGLAAVDLSKGVASIGTGAFSESKLAAVNFTDAGITAIDAEVFKGCKDLKSVELAGITTIGINAFAESGLTGTLTIPAGLTEIKDYAFKGCTNLTVKVPEVSKVADVAKLGAEVFDNDAKFNSSAEARKFYYASSWQSHFPDTKYKFDFTPDTEANDADNGATAATKATVTGFAENVTIIADLKIDDKVMYHGKEIDVKAIDSEAFIKSKGELTGTLRLPASIASIGKGAFKNQSGLAEVNIPAGIDDEIDAEVFSGCTELATVTGILPATIGNSAFKGAKFTTATLPTDGLESIGEYAFAESGLNAVTLAAGASIGNYAFAESGLASVDISKGGASIGDYAFAGSQLTEVDLSDGVASIGKGAFSESKLAAVDFTDSGINAIGAEVFKGCADLKSVELAGITEIGANAFAESGLEGDLTFPEGLTTIDKEAFAGTALTSVTLPEGLTIISEGLFAGSELLSEVTLPASLDTIADEAFAGTALTMFTLASTTPPGLGKDVFKDVTIDDITFGCPDAEDVLFDYQTSAWWPYFGSPYSFTVLPNAERAGKATVTGIVEGIEKATLTAITLPAEVFFEGDYYTIDSIGDGAFEGCTALKTFTLGLTTPPLLGKNVFKGVNTAAVKFTCPTGKVDTYMASAWYPYFADPDTGGDPARYRVTFLQGSDLLYQTTISGGAPIPANIVPVFEERKGYTLFWFKAPDSSAIWNFSSPVIAALTLSPVWIADEVEEVESFAVTFLQDADTLAQLTVDKGEVIPASAIPVLEEREGYTFFWLATWVADGVYESAIWNFSNPVTVALTLSPFWVADEPTSLLPAVSSPVAAALYDLRGQLLLRFTLPATPDALRAVKHPLGVPAGLYILSTPDGTRKIKL